MPTQSAIHTHDRSDLRMIRTLEAYIPKLMRVYDVPGLNIALALHGHLVWEGAYGFSDAGSGRPTTSETVFHSGSIAKAYVAISVLQLAEKGLLQLDAPINRYLPFQVVNPLGGPPITIRHLLTHTSGLGGDIATSYLCDEAVGVRSLADVVAAAYRFQVHQAPIGLKYLHPMWTYPAGQKMQYSNLGVATLGVIVEQINPEHLSYSDYVQRHIMDPLGMRYAQIPPAEIRAMVRPEIWDRMSTGYQTMGGAWIPTAQVCFGEFPCGGSLGTPTDYLHLLLALLGDGTYDGSRILSKESVEAMLSPAHGLGAEASAGGLLALGSRDQQGLIWRLRDWPSDDRAFWHLGGHMFGWETLAVAYPKSGAAFVVAVNHWSAVSRLPGVELDELDTQIRRWVSGSMPEAPPPPANPTPTPARIVWPPIDHLDWKSSYLRGLLFSESYRFAIATPQSITEAQARQIAQRTAFRFGGKSSAHWDGEGFVAGVMDLSRVAPTVEGIRSFVSSSQMRISLEEARAIYPCLGADPDSWATLAGLLSMPPTSTPH